jgi:UDP-sulfoquinovose synthase
MTGAQIEYVHNPREEAESNELCVANSQLLRMGLVPTTLDAALMREVAEIAQRYVHRCDLGKIPSRSLWNHARMRSAQSEPARTPGGATDAMLAAS